MRLFMTFILSVSLLGLSVYDIQYTDDDASPYMGETVEVSGIVSATGFDGDKWFLQDEGGGPWTGVYVFDYEHDVAPGDLVTMTCEVDEYYGLTELKNIAAFASEPGGSVPPAYTATCLEANDEPLEGVLITINDVVVDSVISPGQWYISDGTATLKVGNKFDYELIPAEGAELPSITGIIDYSWETFVLQPRFDEDIDYEPAPPELVDIYDIQYSEDGESPYLGMTVTVSGIVTAINFRGSNYFISDPEVGPWKGLYVYDRDNEPGIGDYVTLTGEIDEYYELTELKDVTSFSIDSTGARVEPYNVSSIEMVLEESMEAVLVSLPEVTIDELGEEGDFVITDGVTSMTVQDGFDTGYEAEIGRTIPGLTGVIHFDWGEYKLNPRSMDDIEGIDENKKPEAFTISAYPNPFNAALAIDAPEGAVIQAFDIEGRLVAEIDNRVWQPKEGIASGIYLIKITSGKYETIKKVSLIR